MLQPRSMIKNMFFRHPKAVIVVLTALPLVSCVGWLLAISQGDLGGMVRCTACRLKAAMMPGSEQPSC